MDDLSDDELLQPSAVVPLAEDEPSAEEAAKYGPLVGATINNILVSNGPVNPTKREPNAPKTKVCKQGSCISLQAKRCFVASSTELSQRSHGG